MSIATTKITVGPEDHGQSMALEDFTSADGQPGYRYELCRGTIVVTELPNRTHLIQLNAVRRQLTAWEIEHPDEVDSIAGGGECKVRIAELETERHPDLSVYKSAPPAIDTRELWSVWVPDLVIEVVSPESADRDYNQKPDEYLQFGVQEYWIVDYERNQMTVHQRAGDAWDVSTISPGESYRTNLLPGLEFDLQAVFDAVNG